MELSNDGNQDKEFYNLNGYYLKISNQNKSLNLICYNYNLLDGIKYETKINLDEIKKNDKIKNLSVSELYKVIIKKIEEQKFTLITEQKQVILTLFKGNAYNSNTDLQLFLLKICQYNNEYENVLSNVIINLREENKNMKKEINEIRNILNKIYGEKELLNLLSQRQPNTEIRLRGKRLLNPKDNLPVNQLPSNKGNVTFKDNPDNNNNNNNNKNIDNVNKTINLTPKSQIIPPIKSKSQLSVKNSLTISCLANLEYGLYPPVELSTNSFCKISGYGANSYNGIVRNYNEDKLKVILDYKLQKTVHAANGNIIYPNISFFGMYDGHGGNKCSNFLQEKFDSFLFNSEYFPLYTLQAINEAYTKAENEFRAIAFDAKNGKLLDKSGSCSITALIIEEWCFITYLGDSRGLYSFDSGNQLYQITRDHKPNDPIEKNRIEKAGGSIYKDDRVKINGQKVHVKEETLAPGVSFPYRVSPGNLAVNNYIFNFFIIGCKNYWRLWI